MNVPVVSVCLLTYNHQLYIRDCLDSAIAQGGDVPMEILVGDDQSSDGTSAIVAEFAARHPGLVIHHLRPARMGAAENYLDLVRRTRGRYVATLDGDDFWLPGKLRAQVEFLDAHPQCPAVYTNAVVVDEDRIVLGIFNNHLPPLLDIDALLRRGNFLNNSSVCFRATMTEVLLAFPVPYLDYKAHLNFALLGPVGYLNQGLVGYRFNSSTSMVARDNEVVRELYWQALIDVPRDGVDRGALGEGMADFLRRVAFRAVRLRRPRLLSYWTARVLEASPYGRLHTLSLTASNIARTVAWELAAWTGSRLSGSRLKVFHRR